MPGRVTCGPGLETRAVFTMAARLWQTDAMSASMQENAPLEEPVVAQRSMMPRVLVLLLGMAAVFIIAQEIQPLRSIVAAAFLALNLVIVVWPIQSRLAKVIPRFLAAVVAGLTAIAVLVVMIWSIGWTVSRLIKELPMYNVQYNQMINRINDLATRYNVDTNAVADQLLQNLRGISFGTAVSALAQVASQLTSAVGLVFMILMILFFMIMDSVGFSDRVTRVGQRHNPAVAWALSSFAQGTRKYWVVTTVFGLIVAMVNWGLLLWLGVPLALIWAMFSFVTNYIPNIGFVIGLVPPVLMALLANDPWVALWVAVGYFAVNTGIQTFIQPKFTGDAVGITPTMAVLSLLIWSYILGPLGAILAIPATLLMKTLFIDIDPNTRWLNAIIASNPSTSDQDPIRLSTLFERAKRIRVLSNRLRQPGVTEEQAQEVNEELTVLEEEAKEDPGTAEEAREISQRLGNPKPD